MEFVIASYCAHRNIIPFLLNYNFLLTICELFLPFLNVIFIASQCAHFTIHANIVTGQSHLVHSYIIWSSYWSHISSHHGAGLIYHLIMVLVESTFELTIAVINFQGNPHIYHLLMVLAYSSSAELTTQSIELLSNHLSRQPDPPSFLSPAQ